MFGCSIRSETATSNVVRNTGPATTVPLGNISEVGTPAGSVAPSATAASTSASAGFSSLERLSALPISDDRVVWQVWQGLIMRCMGERGFKYPTDPYPEDGNVAAMSQLYPSESELATYGYGWRTAIAPAPPQPRAAAVDDGAFHDALNGPADGSSPGCYGIANTSLARNKLDAQEEAFSAAGADLRAAVASSPEVEAITTAWSSCMSEQGYDYSEPRDATSDASQVSAGDPTAPAAIQIAIADIRCQQNVRFAETLQELNVAEVDRWIEDHPTALPELVEAQVEFVAHCKEIAQQLGVELAVP